MTKLSSEDFEEIVKACYPIGIGIDLNHDDWRHSFHTPGYARLCSHFSFNGKKLDELEAVAGHATISLPEEFHHIETYRDMYAYLKENLNPIAEYCDKKIRDISENGEDLKSLTLCAAIYYEDGYMNLVYVKGIPETDGIYF